MRSLSQYKRDYRKAIIYILNAIDVTTGIMQTDIHFAFDNQKNIYVWSENGKLRAGLKISSHLKWSHRTLMLFIFFWQDVLINIII